MRFITTTEAGKNGDFLPAAQASYAVRGAFLMYKKPGIHGSFRKMPKSPQMPVSKAASTKKKRGEPMEQEYLPSNSPQQRLQELMKEHKITQAELASKIGVTESSISRFLNGTKNKLTIEQIISIVTIAYVR